jgi:hypothetical protein
MYYTGIGSRKTPPWVQEHMRRIAQWLAGEGYALRSGAAPGVDTLLNLDCENRASGNQRSGSICLVAWNEAIE